MQRRILVVDDDPLVLSGLSRMLERAGWEVLCASTAEEALGCLVEGRVDAAIIDYDLGDHDGLSVLAHLRDTRPTAIRVLMTGHDDLPVVVAAINRGEAFKVLRKPFQHQELLELLEEARASVDHLTRASITQKVIYLKRERASVEQALRPDQLAFALQPIVDARTHEVFAEEALLRPRHPDFDGPVDLLLAVERHNKVQAFGRAVLLSAAQLLPVSCGRLFVNLHPQQLGEPEALLQCLQPLLPHAGRVVLEITERSRLQDLDNWEASVQILRARGFALAVDDLGAGYSALAMLADLQPEFIKLDRSLLTGLHLSSRKQRLVQLLVRFGDATGAVVIGEGIELDEELKAAVDCGVPLVQGYLLGAPVLQ